MNIAAKCCIGGIVLGATWIGWTYGFAPRPMPKKIRAGYYFFPPYLDVLPDGGPSGFAIDAFAEAARRRGVEVEWVNTKGSPDKALEEHRIDVYPMMARTPERLDKLGLTEPWWELSLAMVSRAEHPIKTPQDLVGGTISIVDLSFGGALVRRLFPKSAVIGTKRQAEVLEPLCDGRAVAAMTEARVVNLWMLRADRPCPGMSLYMQPFDSLVLGYGVGALPENAWLAQAMQATLLDLTIDGTLNRLGPKWNVYATNQIRLFRDLILVKNQRLWLTLALGMLLALFLAFGLLYRRMVLAQRAALAASAMQSQFLANVSHEIRTPLNGILGMAELLRSTRMQPAQREFADAIASSGQVLLVLINDCLDLAKIEAGKIELERISYSPTLMAEQVVQLFYPRACEIGLSIGAYVDPSIPETVLGDPTRVQQVLFNLVGNALKFTAQGEVWMEVKLLADGMLHFSVSDTGSGVPESARARLFERFTQADASTTRIHGGTGLGLAICRELVTLMGGDIGIDAGNGSRGGSRFWFTIAIDPVQAVKPTPLGRRVAIDIDDPCGRRLIDRLAAVYACPLAAPGELADLTLAPSNLAVPVRQSRVLAHLLSDTSTAAPPTAQTQLASLSLRVLVAEDNAVNQRVAMSYLDKLGCQATLVENGELAVAAALGGDFDAILMDYHMPVMDGLEAARKIRAAGGPRGTIPIVAVTAGVLAVDLETIRAAGMDELLPKPYSLSALRSILEAVSTRGHGILQR